MKEKCACLKCLGDNATLDYETGWLECADCGYRVNKRGSGRVYKTDARHLNYRGSGGVNV